MTGIPEAKGGILSHTIENGKKIAVIISGCRYDSQASVMDGILHAARKYGDRVYVFSGEAWGFSASDFTEGENSIYNLIPFDRFDGVILHGDTLINPELTAVLADRIRAAGIPAISLNHREEGMMLTALRNEDGIRDIVRHMVEVHGAKKINFISGPRGNEDSTIRYRTFREELKRFGIPFTEDQCFVGNYHPDSGERAVRFWLKQGRKNFPDTIVCANDEMALGACMALEEAGLRVPEDVKISGYDNAFLGQIHDPAITTVVRMDRELGATAYFKLRSVMDGGEDIGDESIPCRAVFRGSCGCPDHEDDFILSVGDVRRRYVDERADSITRTEILKASSAALTGARNFDEMAEQVVRYIRIAGIDPFALCVNEADTAYPDPADLTRDIDKPVSESGFDKRMVVLAGVCGGQDCKHETIDTADLIPRQMAEEPVAAILIEPLHFGNRTFGYAAVRYDEHARGDLFTTFLINISNAIESIRRQDQLNRLVEHLRRRWIYDPLTGILNRAGFGNQLESVLAKAREKQSEICIFFADLDNLKYVNDTLGHDEGDYFIKEGASALDSTRSADSLLMRYGGDEFVELDPDSGRKKAEARIETIRKRMEAVNKTSGIPVYLDMSVGYTIIPAGEPFDMTEKIEEADKAMYRVKTAKKKAHPEMNIR